MHDYFSYISTLLKAGFKPSGVAQGKLYTSPGLASLKLLLTALTLFTAACDGPVGPQGDTGPQGEQGERGPRGPRGPAGEDGNANVMYSEWMPIDWNVLDANTVKRMDIAIPQITEEFLENGGVVLLFVKSSDSAFPVPMSRDNYSLYFLASGGSNEVRFIAQRLTGLTGDINVTWIQDVRYVLIPDGVPVSGLQAGLKAELDLSDYEAVAAFYGIPDEGAGEVQM